MLETVGTETARTGLKTLISGPALGQRNKSKPHLCHLNFQGSEASHGKEEYYILEQTPDAVALCYTKALGRVSTSNLS